MKNLKHLALILLLVGLGSSCHKDLDRFPINDFTSEDVYSDPANYINVLAKLYGGFSTTGLEGPAGNGDVVGLDEGFSQYLRVYFKLQEVPTDELVIRWGDAGLPELNRWTWGPSNQWMQIAYVRCIYNTTLCNEFIKNSDQDALDNRDFSAAENELILRFNAEARFLKALSLYHALDLFGKMADVRDEDRFPGAEYPEELGPQECFEYIEAELLDIEDKIGDANPYGHADRAAVQTLLAKLYLNAEVYVGQNRYADALNYCERVINTSGHTLDNSYRNLFGADNNLSNEIIFPITSDGERSQSYGATTFLVNASGYETSGRFLGTDSATYTLVGSSYPSTRTQDSTGSSENWQGLIAPIQLLSKFSDSTDSRFRFVTFQRDTAISRVPNTPLTEGFVCKKWINKTSTGQDGPNPDFADTDFPLFRLADVYLMYAEAVLRGGGGSQSQALNYVNEIRERAYGNSSQNLASIDLQTILDERARELYWEAHRRTDLRRYGLYTGATYVWPFKADNAATGAAAPEFRALYPLPATELNANPNLSQNPGY